MKHSILLLLLLLTVYGCGNTPATDRPPNSAGQSTQSKTAESQPESAGSKTAANPTPFPTAVWQEPKDGVPRNVLDFYMMLPAKYFVWDGCARDDDACNKRRKMEDPNPTVDIPNGYLSTGSGLQYLQIAIFKKNDGTYLAAVSDNGTTWYEFYVTEFRNGKFIDVTNDVIPGHSRLRNYELPRQGREITVRRAELNEDDIPSMHEILYHLEWKNDRFVQRRASKDQKE